MNREFKRLSVFVLALFMALFVSSSYIQVIAPQSLDNDPRNVRTLYDSMSAKRGSILIDGTPIVSSVEVDAWYSYMRTYQDGRLYAPITGYFSFNQGSSGIEAAENQVLAGSSDSQFFDQIWSIITGNPRAGASVELTIDPKLQQAAYDALGNRKGAIVVMEPGTGNILAMVSKPSYDPNELSVPNASDVIAKYEELEADKNKPLINRAINGDLYHPGSVFKLLMLTAALENGYSTQTKMPNPRSFKLPGTNVTITNANNGTCTGEDEVTLYDALRLSCNIPFAELGIELGADTIMETAEKYGFGEDLNIPLHVTPSIFPEGMDDAQLAMASFGQFDVRVTPLQIAMISATIANNGKLMKPQLIDSVISPDLKVLEDPEPELLSEPMSESTAAQIRSAMIAAVKNGVAGSAQISGVDVAGKTGTAENGEGQPFTLWFTGFAPAENPKAVVAVVVEDTGGGTSSGIAAPIGKLVMEAVINK